MSNVYAPMVPSRFDPGSNLWIPSIEIAPAERYGKILIMLPPNGVRAGTAPCVAAIKEKMEHFSADDYLIGVGDPTLIAAAACIAVRKTGGLLRMLKWDRMAKDYLGVEMRV